MALERFFTRWQTLRTLTEELLNVVINEDWEKVEQVQQQRQMLLEVLNQFDVNGLNEEQASSLRQTIADIQAVEKLVVEKINNAQQLTNQNRQQANKSQKALNAYLKQR